jgi:type IV pilus assembly protein PilE
MSVRRARLSTSAQTSWTRTNVLVFGIRSKWHLLRIVDGDATLKKQRGFTLIELMIVVVIVGVLLGIALPGYQNYVLRTNRTAAQADLLAAAQAMEKHFAINFTYAGTAAGTTFPSEAPTDASVKRYDLTLPTADPSEFLIQATPKGAQAGDGILQINNLGQRFWDKNDNGNVADAGENNWDRR